MNNSIFLILLAIASYSQALDWFLLTQQNYAAIQSGLSQLNAAAALMHRSMVEQQNLALAAVDGLTVHMNRSLADLKHRYPATNVTTDRLDGTEFYAGFVRSTTDQFRQSVTNNVMVPAQVIVRDILDAMNDLFSERNRNCAERYASNLVQPSISVGRLKDCLITNIPFFRGLTSATQLLLNYAKAAVDSTMAQVQLCSPDSSNCLAKFCHDLPDQLNNIINSVGNLYGTPSMFSQSAVARNQECVALITTDIQETIQEIRTNVTNCAASFKPCGIFGIFQCSVTDT
ncbi:uncharacterized protein LOC131681438 [Topomyia yanbarensis]|uniref:uncharacterized protein LOC131681438 n=1 Tax=Topomyia yanbarensis TaxID=2498891 RepID=UPI00273B4CD1|nr:uncharacterized protein LOC131681438 [Topomyia yanbarensis]